jgi:hypothetical protein
MNIMMLALKRYQRIYHKCNLLGSLKIIRCLSLSLDHKQPRARLEQFTMQFKQKEKILKVANYSPYPTFKCPKPSYRMQISAGDFQQQVELIAE